MDYMLMFRETNAELARRDDPSAAQAYWGAWNAYVTAIAASGITVGGNALQPSHTATTVRIREGKRQVQDGPFADTHEHLGGYFIIRVDTLDQALEWAARAPCAAGGSVEVRPVLPAPAST